MQALSKLALLLPAFRLLHCTLGPSLHCSPNNSIICTAYLLQTCIARHTNPTSALQVLSKLALLVTQIQLLHCKLSPNLHCSSHKSSFYTAYSLQTCIAHQTISASAMQTLFGSALLIRQIMPVKGREHCIREAKMQCKYRLKDKSTAFAARKCIANTG